MYKLLSDVRDHLVKIENPKPTTSTKKRSPVKNKKKKSRNLEESVIEFDSESSDLPVVTMASDVLSAGSLSLFESATMGSTMKDTFTTSPLKAESNNGARDRPPSPVSELLGQADLYTRKHFPSTSPLKKSDKKILQDNTDSNSEFTSDSTTDIPATNTAALKNAITTTAEDLCKQLQDRLEGLSKMGGKLKEQNKKTEKMIQRQDEKLQKVRGGLKFR